MTDWVDMFAITCLALPTRGEPAAEGWGNPQAAKAATKVVGQGRIYCRPCTPGACGACIHTTMCVLNHFGGKSSCSKRGVCASVAACVAKPHGIFHVQTVTCNHAGALIGHVSMLFHPPGGWYLCAWGWGRHCAHWPDGSTSCCRASHRWAL